MRFVGLYIYDKDTGNLKAQIDTTTDIQIQCSYKRGAAFTDTNSSFQYVRIANCTQLLKNVHYGDILTVVAGMTTDALSPTTGYIDFSTTKTSLDSSQVLPTPIFASVIYKCFDDMTELPTVWTTIQIQSSEQMNSFTWIMLRRGSGDNSGIRRPDLFQEVYKTNKLINQNPDNISTYSSLSPWLKNYMSTRITNISPDASTVKNAERSYENNINKTIMISWEPNAPFKQFYTQFLSVYLAISKDSKRISHEGTKIESFLTSLTNKTGQPIKFTSTVNSNTSIEEFTNLLNKYLDILMPGIKVFIDESDSYSVKVNLNKTDISLYNRYKMDNLKPLSPEDASLTSTSLKNQFWYQNAIKDHKDIGVVTEAKILNINSAYLLSYPVATNINTMQITTVLLPCVNEGNIIQVDTLTDANAYLGLQGKVRGNLWYISDSDVKSQEQLYDLTNLFGKKWKVVSYFHNIDTHDSNALSFSTTLELYYFEDKEAESMMKLKNSIKSK